MICLAAHRNSWDNLSERGAGGTMGRWPKKSFDFDVGGSAAGVQ
jgi:hypothetical protein